MSALPRVSLVMPNRNNAPVLDRVLGRLAEHTTYDDYELVVVDDGSTDESLEILRRWRESGRLRDFRLLEREHGGVVHALNAGLQAATGELVVQLDADASVETPGWLERMVDFFLSDDRIGVVTAKIVLDRGTIHACGVSIMGRGGLHDRGTRITERPGLRTYHFRVLRPFEDECALCDEIAEVDAGIGCCMMYRRDVALAAGGYDSNFNPVWFDDLDLTISIRRQGYKVFYVPFVRVSHLVGGRGGRDERRTRRQATADYLRRAGSVFPSGLRWRAMQALKLDRPPPAHAERLAHHYAYWREKWGFDVLNPDTDSIRRRWGDTEICWRDNPEMLEAGRRIVANYLAHSAAG